MKKIQALGIILFSILTLGFADDSTTTGAVVTTTATQSQDCTNPNELWLDCGESCYEDFCQKRQYLVPCESECKPGCYCQCGYYRNVTDNTCQPKGEFPSCDNTDYENVCPTPECGKHEVYTECGSYCGGECKNHFYPTTILCINKCKIGCICKDGYLRHPITNECVLADSCPTPKQYDYKNNVVLQNSACPGKHEVYTKCGSFCGGTCRDFRIPINYLCIRGCRVGCICADGFLRHPVTGECVPKNTCPTTDEYDYRNNVILKSAACGRPHEVFKTCGSFCGGTCASLNSPIKFLSCIALCKTGCFCVDGYFRHPITDECVKADKCPTAAQYDYVNDVPIKTCKTKKCRLTREVKNIIAKAFGFLKNIKN